MKMIIAILRDTDSDPVSKALTDAQFRVTCVASTSGFLRRGRSTLLIGVQDEQVQPALRGSPSAGHRIQQIPFLAYQEQDTKPTLFIVHVESHWSEYGGLLDLSNPFLDSPFIFSWSATPIADEALSASFPDRIVYHYYPLSRPGKFFPLPLPYPPE